MARIIIEYIVPFLLPTAIYASWVWSRAGYVARHGGEAPRLEQGPWPLLLFLGAVCALGVLGVTGFMRGGAANSVLRPAPCGSGQGGAGSPRAEAEVT